MSQDVLQGGVMALASSIWASQLWRIGTALQEGNGQRISLYQPPQSSL